MKQRLGILALAGALLLACRGPQEPAEPQRADYVDLGLDLEPVIVGGRQLPKLWVAAKRFRGPLGPTAAVALNRDYHLQFVPLALSADAATAAVETYLRIDGDELRLSAEPLRWAPASADVGGAVAAVLPPVDIDLSAYRGKTVELTWRLVGGSTATRAAIASPKLVTAPGGARQPDVLFVCSDTHRSDFAPGPPDTELMPQLRELERQSVVYRRAFASASWTMPSIASLLTGLFPRYHLTGRRIATMPSKEFRPQELPPGQFGFNIRPTTRILSAYPDQLETLPEHLQSVGYATALVVSNPLYHLSGLAFDGVDLSVNVGVAPAAPVNRAAFEILRRAPTDRPLFLLVHFMDVHEWAKYYFEKSYPELDRRRSPAEVRQSYAEAVRASDRALGELLDEWSSVRDLDATLVAFFSDHGEHLLDPPEAPLLGHGNSMGEELLRVPLVIRYPKGIGGSPSAVDRPVSLVDLAPTVLDAVGLPYDPQRFSGRSLLTPVAGERILFADFQLYGQDLSSVRQGDWKLNLNLETEEVQLFQISEAGAATRAADGSPSVRQLRRAFISYVQASRRATEHLKYDRQIDQREAQRQLEALGYVQ